MLNFQSKKGYPMVHIVERVSVSTVRYQFTDTQDPEIGEEAATINSQFMPNMPNADLVEIESIEEPKSPHHPVSVKLYTCIFQLRPIEGKIAA